MSEQHILNEYLETNTSTETANEYLETNTATKTLIPYEQKQQKINEQYEKDMQTLQANDDKLSNIKKGLTAEQIEKKITKQKQKIKNEKKKIEKKVNKLEIVQRMKKDIDKITNKIKNEKNEIERKIKEQKLKFEKIKAMESRGLSNNKEKIKQDRKLQLMFNTKPKNIKYKKPIIKQNQKQNSIL